MRDRRRGHAPCCHSPRRRGIQYAQPSIQSLPSRSTGSPGPGSAKPTTRFARHSARRSFSEGGKPGDDTANGEAASEQRASGRSPGVTKGSSNTAARSRRGQISNVWGKGCRQCPGVRRTRASANTSGPDFTLARRPLVKLRSSLRRTAPNEENSFLLPDRRNERSDR